MWGRLNEQANLDVVSGFAPARPEVAVPDRRSHAAQITRVADRPGHDGRYAINCSKPAARTGWSPREIVRDRPSKKPWIGTWPTAFGGDDITKKEIRPGRLGGKNLIQPILPIMTRQKASSSPVARAPGFIR